MTDIERERKIMQGENREEREKAWQTYTHTNIKRGREKDRAWQTLREKRESHTGVTKASTERERNILKGKKPRHTEREREVYSREKSLNRQTEREIIKGEKPRHTERKREA